MRSIASQRPLPSSGPSPTRRESTGLKCSAANSRSTRDVFSLTAVSSVSGCLTGGVDAVGCRDMPVGPREYLGDHPKVAVGGQVGVGDPRVDPAHDDAVPLVTSGRQCLVVVFDGHGDVVNALSF